MLYTNLKDSPNFVQKAVDLIESSFGYTSMNSFSVDFYPLIKESNHKNCHIIINNDEVVAHIGVLERQIEINKKNHTIYMYGGIAVSDKYRGKGLFKKLFNSLDPLYEECALHLLWSDKLDLYKKFNFHPCIGLYEYKKESFKHSFRIVQSKLKDIDSETFKEIKVLYSNNEIRINRNDQHWDELKEITSSDLFLIYKGNKLVNYFIMNKGADLDSIIHEYADSSQEQIQVMANYGIVWSSRKTTVPFNTLYASVVKVGNEALFKKLIENVTDFEIIKMGSDVIEFKNKNDVYTQPIADFLIGVFGPGKFEETQNTKSLYICGVDSI